MNKHSPRAKYEALIAELDAIAKDRRLYLVDESVDRENALDSTGAVDGSDDYWHRVYDSAVSAAASRAADAGHDINDLVGRVIY